ncbi:hypothetical protein [Flavobacterium sp. H122]|uniref:hypothetical protein n=1 Tax=Flavobacterium sp. H122 TaxID=2529860 RepID=UPI0010AA5AD3|nr:hypothetical protein [Flavobacterium sp. H122]
MSFFILYKTLLGSLLSAFILGSCSIYKTEPISIDNAISIGTTVKVIKIDNQKIKLQRIEKSDSIYYGIKKSKGQIIKVPLEPNQIKSIHEIDKTSSAISTVLSITGGTSFATLIITTLISNASFGN